MPNEVFGLFDSNDGDRKYSADDFVGFFADFFTNGIVADSTTYLQVKADSGMTLSVNSGKAYINGGFFKPQTPTALALPDSDTTYPRYDLIVLRWDKVLRSIYLDVVSGVGAETPAVPALTRNETTYELGLASVYIGANVVEITQANITDLRFNNNYCGVVTGVIDTIDTTALFAQYEKAWYDFVAQLDDADPEKITINTADEQARTDLAALEADIKARVVTSATGNALKVLTGTTSVSSTTITFSVPFSTVPVVVAIMKPSSTNINTAYVSFLTTVSKSSFSINSKKVTTTSVDSNTCTAHWIAIGT